MQAFLFIIGLLVFIFGLLYGFSGGGLALLLAGFVAGPLLMGLSKVIQLLEEISHKLLRMPFTLDQVWQVIKNSPKYETESQSFEVYPNPRGDSQYQLVVFDDEYYIKARVFKKYIKPNENELVFEMPNQEPITLQKSYAYYPGVELFDFREQVFVMLKKINVYPVIEGKSLKLEYFEEE